MHHVIEDMTPANSDASSDAAGDPDDPPPPSADRPEVTVDYAPPLGPDTEPTIDEGEWLQAQVVSAAAEVSVPLHRVGVRVVRDEEMARMHVAYMGIDGPTDVLTFAVGDDAARAVDVDIVVNRDEAARCAQRGGHPIRHELLLYIVHGILHEAGYDDRDPAAARAMHLEEDRILSAIGVGRVFDAGEAQS